MSQTQSIPVIDVSALDSADAAERQACGDAIGAACRDIGFFYATGHGVPPALLDAVMAEAEGFFAQPLPAKMQVALSRETGWQGYFPLAGEVTDPTMGGDPKEGFDIALSGEGATPWPARPETLRPVLTTYYEAVSDLGRTLSRGFALSLRLPEDFFAAKLNHPTAILRILHYPPTHTVADPASLPPFGCGAHSDYGYLTILAQDGQGGLQVQTRAGEWVDATPMPGHFVCNIGEMMARWTNDAFRATPHRVVRLKPEARYSVPFFFHPDPDVEIAVLPTCLAPGEIPRYSPTTSGAYLQARQEGAYA